MHLFYDTGGVSHWVGVGHRMNSGESAFGCGSGTGFYSLGVVVAGLAEVGVQVYQSGQHDLAGSVDHLSAGGGKFLAKLCNRAVGINGYVGLHAVGGGAASNHIGISHSLPFHCPS